MNKIPISIKKVSKSFKHNEGSLLVLHNLSLEIRDGEFLSILGPSGCGKTTLLKLIGGLLHPTSGIISVKGKSPNEARRDREFGFIFQNAVLFPWRTVFKNVILPIEISSQNKKEGIRHKKKQDRYKIAHKMIDLVGLSGFKSTFPRQLSGGMQSRVAIARALSFRPSILLMDEPFGDLDELTRAKMNLELLRLWSETNTTIAFVTHSIQEAIFNSDRVAVLTHRPCRVAEIVNIQIPRPRNMGVYESPQFGEYSKKLKKILGLNVRR